MGEVVSAQGPFRIQRCRSAGALPAGWDSLLGAGDLYHTAAWLELGEAIRALPAVHLVAGEPPAAGLSCHLVGPDDAPSPITRVDRVLARLHALEGREPAWFADLLPSAVCGGRLASHTRLHLSPGLAAGERDALVAALLGEAEAWAREAGARTVCWLMVDASDAVLRPALAAAGYQAFAGDGCCTLEVRWNDFDGYLASLPGRRRRDVRQELDRLAAAGVQLAVGPLSPERVPELARLEQNLLRRHGNPRQPEAVERSLARLASRFAGSALVSTATRGHQALGFLVLLPWRDELHARNAGFDREAGGDLPLYFGTCFYAPVAHAIEHGFNVIDYAGGAADAKLARGCRLVPQLLFVRAFDPALDACLAGLAGTG
jgi:uncharacterized protein